MSLMNTLNTQIAQARQADIARETARRGPRYSLPSLRRPRKRDAWWIMSTWQHGSPAPGS
jgi:hypothetical protein